MFVTVDVKPGGFYACVALWKDSVLHIYVLCVLDDLCLNFFCNTFTLL